MSIEVSSLREVTALVVESDSSNAALERVVIERCGFRVTVASKGHEALSLIHGFPFDVIVVGSPAPIGREILIDHLATAGSTVRRTVVVTTQSESPDFLRRAFAANVFAIVAKPFDIADLVRVVQQCLANGGAPGETLPPKSRARTSRTFSRDAPARNGLGNLMSRGGRFADASFR